MKRIILFMLCLLYPVLSVQATEDPMIKLRDETMHFFRPVTGKIVAVDGNNITISLGSKDLLKKKMRFNVLREGEPFLHPVTKELLGHIESRTGTIEITDVQEQSSTGILIDGTARAGDKVRITESKIRVFFCQDKTIDWYLADEYYRKLRETGRIIMIDTALDAADEKRVIDEARKNNADVVLILSARDAERSVLMREQLFWVSDGSRFFDTEIKLDIAYTKELKFGEGLFSTGTGEAITMYDLPFGARYIVTGDFDGDGKQEIALSTGKDIRFYQPSVDLKPLWEVKGKVSDDHIWIDSIDLNKNGRDEIIVTSLKDEDVTSYIYELSGAEFKKLWEGKYFLRRVGDSLLAQTYSGYEGYEGNVINIVWNGEYKTGEKVKLPGGINLYDFVYIETPSKQQYIFAYDSRGFLNLYNEKGIKIWTSSKNTGGFIAKFKKKATTTYKEGEEWSVKDRLISRNREVLVVQRIPLAEVASGLGYKSSMIKNYWWNGFAMDEGVVLEDIKGSVLDYALVGDKMIVLTSPFLGIKFENILKGESPLGSVLYIYAVKGR